MKSRRIIKSIIFYGLLIGLVAGCSEKPHTVQWYMDHKTERDAKVHWCGDDTARSMTDDCMNAAKAYERVMLDPKTPSVAETFVFKPGQQPPANNKKGN